MNGFFLFATIVFALIVAGQVDDNDVVWYVLLATLWVLSAYWRGLELLGHVMDLQEELAEPHESLQAIRERAETFPGHGNAAVPGCELLHLIAVIFGRSLLNGLAPSG